MPRPLILLVRPEGFEPPTHGLEGRFGQYFASYGFQESFISNGSRPRTFLYFPQKTPFSYAVDPQMDPQETIEGSTDFVPF